jgi:hypothetical protein
MNHAGVTNDKSLITSLNMAVAGKTRVVDNSRRQEQQQNTRARKADFMPGEFLSVNLWRRRT